MKSVEQKNSIWRFWVDTRQRIVSFHPVEGFRMMEFRNWEQFLGCIDEYLRCRYRYQ